MQSADLTPLSDPSPEPVSPARRGVSHPSWLLTVGVLLCLLSVGIYDLYPVFTMKHRYNEFLGLAATGRNWSEVEPDLQQRNYLVLPAPSSPTSRTVRIARRSRLYDNLLYMLSKTAPDLIVPLFNKFGRPWGFIILDDTGQIVKAR